MKFPIAFLERLFYNVIKEFRKNSYRREEANTNTY
nr:MAG TPA: hypothetical protein [Caudoviricetes sp.]